MHFWSSNFQAMTTMVLILPKCFNMVLVLENTDHVWSQRRAPDLALYMSVVRRVSSHQFGLQFCNTAMDVFGLPDEPRTLCFFSTQRLGQLRWTVIAIIGGPIKDGVGQIVRWGNYIVSLLRERRGWHVCGGMNRGCSRVW